MHATDGHYTAVLLDPDLRWLEAVESVLERAGVEVVVGTTSIEQALKAVAERQPSLLVTEAAINGAPNDGIDCVREARRLLPTLKSVVLASHEDAARAAEALEAGALAYLVKPPRPEDLPAAARRAFGGAIYLSAARPVRTTRPAAAPRLLRDEPRLTRRERQILRLAMEGMTNGELAKALWVTEPTVKFHLSNIYRKLGVANRAEATRWARENGFAPLRRVS